MRTPQFTFTLESAQRADETGQLTAWLQDYLRGEGNNHKLADILLKSQPITLKLENYPLNKLIRIMGPEPGMIFSESAEIWEKRVGELENCLARHETLPPLIVTDIWQDWQLSDGSHRHEALLRSGIQSYWTIFVFTKLESESLLMSSLAK